MAKYYPENRAGQINWHTNFAREFPTVGTALGFSNAEITSAVNDSNYAVYLLQKIAPLLESTAKALTGYVHTVVEGQPAGAPLPLPQLFEEYPPGPPAVPPGIDTRRQARVERIKRADAYTAEVIGRQLGIVAAEGSFRPETYRAELGQPHQTAPNKVAVLFRKGAGKIDGIHLYRQRRGDPAPVLVRFFMRTPAVDTAPLVDPLKPETITYTGMAVVNDEEIGQRSEGRTVTVS